MNQADQKYSNVNNSNHKPVKVLIVDDQITSLLVKRILEVTKNIECVGTIHKDDQVIHQLTKIPETNVVLLDIGVHRTDNAELIRDICVQFPEVSVLAYGSRVKKDNLHEALIAGAKGCLLKGCTEGELIDAIMAVSHGYSQFSTELLPLISSELSSSSYVSKEKAIQEDEEDMWASITKEKIESMPRVSLKILLYLLIAAITMIIPWSLLFKFTVTAEALGKLEPSSKTYQLDAPVSGKITEVNIKSGQKVLVDQTLLKLDSRSIESDLIRNQQQLKTKQDRLRQLKYTQQQKQEQHQELLSQVHFQQAQQQAEIEGQKAEVEAKQLDLVKAKIRSQGAKSKADRYSEAHAQGALSRDLLATTQDLANEEQQNVTQVKAEIIRVQANYEKSLSTLSTLIAEGKIEVRESQREIKELHNSLSETNSEIKQIQSSITLLKHQLKDQTIVSPIDGKVFELLVSKPGKVVNQGESLVSIAPQNSQPIFRGHVKTKDSGFLKVGMAAKIKLDSHSWREYGVVEGKVKWISPTSFTNSNNEEVYELEIELKDKEHSDIDLAYGQTALAEIKVKERKIIHFWLH